MVCLLFWQRLRPAACCRRAARSGARRGGPLRPGRRPAQPQSALPPPRRRFGRAAARPPSLRAVRRPRRARAAESRRCWREIPTPRQRRALGRRADDSLPAARGRALERRRAGHRAGRALHAARDSRSAQSGALARRLRPHRPRRTRAAPRTVVVPSQARVGAGGDDLFLVRVLAAVRPAGARAARRRRRSRAPPSTPRRASATGRIASSRGGAAKGCATSPIRAIGAARRRSRRSTFARSPIRRRTCCCCNRARSTGICSRRRSSRSCAATRASPSSPCRPPSSPGLAFNTRARAARRRSRAARDRDVDRSRRDLDERSRWALSGDQHDAAAFLLGVRSFGARAGVRSGAAPTGSSTRAGWRRGADGRCARTAARLQLVYVQFPEIDDGRSRRDAVQAALRERGVDVVDQSRQQRAALSCRAPACWRRATSISHTCRGRWAPIRTIRRCSRCGAPSNYMRWCDRAGRAARAAALARRDRAVRKRLYGQIGAIVAREVPILYLFNADYVYAYRERLRGFAPNAFLPTWNAGALEAARAGLVRGIRGAGVRTLVSG